MLNPIDTAAVIRDGGAVGHYPGQIHEAVAWWLGSCLVVTTKAPRLAVAHDDTAISVGFADRLCRGAINAQHYACRVGYLGHQSEQTLLDAATGAFQAPAAWVSTDTDDDATIVRIRLYTQDGRLLDDSTGLADIRDLIDSDRVPIPVNSQAKGTIERWPAQATTGAQP
ncbi:hypothetical protein ACFXAW_31355 [Streptomyces sp. NPDC059445]|uniref:hypothetical protein n=1 Tax=Streptomyces sp. NPDC059445 TaxID=3346832 RepID=UPI00369C1150